MSVAEFHESFCLGAERDGYCRIVVRFEGSTPGGELALEYTATWSEATEFALAAVGVPGLRVTVDHRVRPGLRLLPCRRLWH
ncbi:MULTISPECIES: hypothetical protein [unclassified Nocardia]|uniref:hypothetical protein n=1 Tax=unclassified Nocardia TaxID=2637762 RepID=UPI0035DC84D8